jgi:hypothetical protein
MRREFQNVEASFRLQGLERMNQVVSNGRLPETIRSSTNLSGAVRVRGNSPCIWQPKFRLAAIALKILHRSYAERFKLSPEQRRALIALDIKTMVVMGAHTPVPFGATPARQSVRLRTARLSAGDDRDGPRRPRMATPRDPADTTLSAGRR